MTDQTDADRVELGPTMRVEDAAKILGVGRTTLYHAIKRGEVPILRIGGRIFVRRATVERLLDDGGAPATTAASPAPPAEPIPHAPLTERPDEVLDRRIRDLGEAAALAERRAIAAQRTLAYEPPQLKLEFFAPNELGGVGWRLSIVGAAGRVDRSLLLVETLVPAYDRLMELIEEGTKGAGAQDRRRYRRRMAK